MTGIPETMPGARVSQTHCVFKPFQKVWNGTKDIGEKIASIAKKCFNAIFPKNPVTHKRQFRVIPTSMEKELGASLYDELCPQDKILTSGEWHDQVEEVGKKLADVCDRPELDFEFRVMEDDKVINAFCLPGGKIVVTTGLLNKLQNETVSDSDIEELKIKDVTASELNKLTFEDKLAALLGHEITHACAAHSAMKMQLGMFLFIVGKVAQVALSIIVANKVNENNNKNRDENSRTDPQIGWEAGRATGELFNLGWTFASSLIQHKHSRCNESQSDRVGMKYAYQAEYDVKGSIWLHMMFAKIHGHNRKNMADWFNTHPHSAKRVDECIATSKQIEKGHLDEIC